MEISHDLFSKLISSFVDTEVKVRLIAEVNYSRLNDKMEIVENYNFHFPSYQSEKVVDVHDFYERHMFKIVSRMDDFHRNGSRLMLNKITHIHVALSKCQRCVYIV